MLSWYVLISFWFEARQVAQPKFARGAPQAGTAMCTRDGSGSFDGIQNLPNLRSWEMAKVHQWKDFTEDKHGLP